MTVIGYRHTGLIVSDLDKSLDFYQGFLKLEVLQNNRDESDYIAKITGLNGLIAEYTKLLIPGGSVLELLTYPSHPELRAKREIHHPGEAHLAFQVNSVEDMFSQVVSAKIPYISPPVLSSEKIAKVFFCLDPDGYRIELVEMLTDSYSWNSLKNG
jgi:catechol 2,3-dioxygenase-like lactoylglutathione lyase family enzyme